MNARISLFALEGNTRDTIYVLTTAWKQRRRLKLFVTHPLLSLIPASIQVHRGEEPFGTEDRSAPSSIYLWLIHERGHLLGLMGPNHSLLLGSTRTHLMASPISPAPSAYMDGKGARVNFEPCSIWIRVPDKRSPRPLMPLSLRRLPLEKH